MVHFRKKTLCAVFFGTHCLLLMRMQLTFIARVGSLNTRNECRRKTHTVNNMSLSLHDLPSTGPRLLDVSFITSLKSISWTDLITQNTTKIILLSRSLSLSHTHTHTHTHNTKALQLNVLLNVIYQLLVTSKGRSTSPNSKKKKSRSTENSSVSVCMCKRTPQNSLQLA